MKKHIADFYNYLTTNHPKVGTGHSWYLGNPDSDKDLAQFIEYLSSLPKKALKRIISDTHWNSYPTYRCYYGGDKSAKPDPKNYFKLFSPAIKEIIMIDHDLRREFINHSEGIFRSLTLLNTLGRDKLKAAKIGIKSGDIRVRKVCAVLLPVSELEKHFESEKHSDVRCKIINRVGYLNMKDQSKSDNSNIWDRSVSFVNSPFSKEEITELSDLVASGGKSKIYIGNILDKLTYYIEPKDTVFFLGVLNQFQKQNQTAYKSFLAKMQKGATDKRNARTNNKAA